MQEIVAINHIGIRVSNLESAKKFYGLLGFEFLAGPIGPEPVAILKHPSGVIINLIVNANSGLGNNILMDIADKYPGYTHMALDVHDIKSIQKSLQKLGIAISEGPIKLPDGGKMLFIRDPDRNVIEFHQDG